MLAERLRPLAKTDPVVLAIPRGGVIIGAEIAERLPATLDVVIPRKMGAPFNPELAVGAVTEDGTMILDHDLVQQLNVSKSYLEEESKRQIQEIKRRMSRYRQAVETVSATGRQVIVVDDGIATGSTMLAAIASIKKSKPLQLVVAVPVAPSDTESQFRKVADEYVCLHSPEFFAAIGQFYLEFEQVSDEEVIEALIKARFRSAKK